MKCREIVEKKRIFKILMGLNKSLDECEDIKSEEGDAMRIPCYFCYRKFFPSYPRSPIQQ
ncbi:hypothetical protein RJ641_001649 [Dillenia turbinata]|uniref:Uncharacterized protein n=1 Tax=Dillenia turbinata TaxID=194707 RepID=A0AAN8ZEP6_9MAGN